MAVREKEGYYIQLLGWAPGTDVAEKLQQELSKEAASEDRIGHNGIHVEFIPSQQSALPGMTNVQIRV